MTIYAIGDVQGCFNELEQLLQQIAFDPTKDTLWFTGDIVNRGPQSLEVLRFIKNLGDKHQTVLGNHDLHLLAVAYGVSKVRETDTLNEILKAPDRAELIEWLRHRPLICRDEATGFIMIHAGLAPQWDLDTAYSLAHEIEASLRGEAPERFLAHMYGNHPDHWLDELTGVERWRCIVNYFTRMRYCYLDGRLNLSYHGTLEHKPEDLVPWFEVPNRVNQAIKVIFGHWAALGGKTSVANIYPLDTGCVWGGSLTALRLSDEKRFSLACKNKIKLDFGPV